MKDDSKTIKAARSRAWYWNGGVMLEQHKDLSLIHISEPTRPY